MTTSRRSILKASITLAMAGLFGRSSDAQILRKACTDDDHLEPFAKSPHCQALALVFENQRYAIRDIETRFVIDHQGERPKSYVEPESTWWFDTDERHWKVRRSGPPGTMDTTHLFYVSYFISDVEVGRWFVNTEKNTIDENLEFLAAQK